MPQDTRKPTRTILAVVAALVAALSASHVAALLHQRHAVEEARSAERTGQPVLIRLEHLARCISLASPLGTQTTRLCLDEATDIEDGMIRSGTQEGARLATSIIDGAIASSSQQASLAALRATGPSRVLLHDPEGSHPLAHASIRAREPWGMMGSFAAVALAGMAVWVFGVAPLARRPMPLGRRARLAAALAAVMIFALGLVGTWLA